MTASLSFSYHEHQRTRSGKGILHLTYHVSDDAGEQNILLMFMGALLLQSAIAYLYDYGAGIVLTILISGCVYFLQSASGLSCPISGS